MKVSLAGNNTAAPVTAQTKGPNSVQRAIEAFRSGKTVSESQQEAPKVEAAKPIEIKQESVEAKQSHPIEHKASIESVEAEVAQEATKSQEESLSQAATQEEPALSKQYAILARKEKALRARTSQMEQQMKAKEQELAEREKALQGKSNFDESKYIPRERLQEDLMSVLAEAGITYDQVTEAVLNQPKRDPYVDAKTRALEAKIASLEEKLDGVNKNSQEQQTQAYQQALAQIERDAKSLIERDPAYETVKGTGQVKEVVKLIEKTFQDSGELLSIEEAAQMVEDELLERFLSTAQSVKKIQERLQPKASAKPEAEKKQESVPAQQSQQLKTLTNNVGSPARKMSAKERAIAAFKGEKF
jgi:hypothetical protein